MIEACYLSLERYSLGSLLYYVFSADVFKLGFGAFVRYMKRFVFGKIQSITILIWYEKSHTIIIIYSLVVFLHFGFQINGINTRYLATILLLISCICVSSALIRLPMLKNSVFQKLLNSTIIYNIIVWLIPICLMTMDFSMLSGTIRFLFAW